MAICPVCGRVKCIHWPEHWVYRRGSTFYCGEQCMDTDLYRDMQLLNEVKRRRKGMTLMSQKITLEMKKKAVEIAISGKSPLPYLKNCGSTAPDKTWYAIKAVLKEKDPETYAKIPDFRGKTRTAKDATPKPISGGEWEKMETPEAPKRAPLVYDGYTVCCIESKTFGRFYWDRDHNHLDWTTAEGEEVSFTPTGWKMFLEEMPKVAEILGVEL